MIHIMSLAERAAREHIFDSMFEERKRLFVDLLGWDVPVIDDRFEIDAFDTLDAIYIVAVDDEGRHQGSLRLLPSSRPHILSGLFDSWCPAGVPTGKHIFEITRLCLPARLDTAQRLEVRKQLISAMVDYALAHEITRLTGIVDARFRSEILAMGWLSEPLGPVNAHGSANLGAFAIHIGPDTPERLRWTDIYRDHQIADAGDTTARVVA